tara:strand:+ start:9938 stop:10237 length:300 start_codon:yes stop_codon:yes gene_type:complete
MMTKAWNNKRNGGITKLAVKRVNQLMDDGEERSISEIIDALLSQKTNNKSIAPKYSVPTRNELRTMLKTMKYARRKVRKTVRLQNGMVFRHQEIRFKKQ